MTHTKANKRSIRWLLVVWLAASSSNACSELRVDATVEWELIERHNHDSDRFTQGLELKEGRWLESSGGYGRSFVVLETEDEVLAQRHLPPSEFAEGASFTPAGIWLLTWRAGKARLLDEDLQLQRTAGYDGEGWGLSFDGERLIMSDGTHRLTHRDAASFQKLKSVAVTEGGRALPRLNELEFAHGLLWANIFGSTRVAALNPYTGEVCGWLHLGELAADFERPPGWDAADNVLNGIAADEGSGHLHLTGKRWPWRYEIAVSLRERHRECARKRP
jgi:glutaminyl-peptide cyclotransferase